MKLTVPGILYDGSIPRPTTPPVATTTLNLEIGGTLFLNVPVVTPAGRVINTSVGTLVFTLKKKAAWWDWKIAQLSPTYVAGVAQFQIAPSVTRGRLPGVYYWDVWYTDASGNRDPVIPTSVFNLTATVAAPP